jgi:putative PIN family toxin of toxin-antitoxin system
MRRIVIDTNCLLAILPSKSPYHKVWTDFLEGELEFCVSNEVLIEYEEILSQKTSPFFADAIIKTLINKRNLVRVSPVWRFRLIENDPDDNKFVDCAVCGQAEYLVSNDKHFTILKEIGFPQLHLLKLQEFALEV